MKHVAIAAFLLMLIPAPASALDTDEILGLVAMPLAVAAVSNVTGVPVQDLSHLVATLNRAEVQPTQFVQVIRYAPVVLVAENDGPAFVQFVDTQVDQGVVGTRLVTVIDQRLRTYDVTPQFVVLSEPAPVFVMSDDYIPVRTQFVAGDTNDLLALIAMPLAVSAAAELSGISSKELTDLIVALNQANVAPVQFVQVLEQPQTVQFVRTRVVEGVRGPALVNVVAERTHPHGGPPGQIKKQLGLQTGAEVVHGRKPGRGNARREVRPVRVVEQPRVVVERPPDRGRGGPKIDNSGKGNKGQGNQGKGNQGKGNQGKGKGKGKD